MKVASSQILEIIERANENKNSELVDLEKESNLWEPLEKLWRWGEVSLPQKAFEFIQKRDRIKKHQRVLAKNENKISMKRQKTLWLLP